MDSLQCAVVAVLPRVRGSETDKKCTWRFNEIPTSMRMCTRKYCKMCHSHDINKNG